MEGLQCAICLCVASSGDDQTWSSLPCGHLLHTPCIDMLLARADLQRCPICREDISVPPKRVFLSLERGASLGSTPQRAQPRADCAAVAAQVRVLELALQRKEEELAMKGKKVAKLREKLRNEEQRSEELEEENRDAQQTAEQARQASEAAYAQAAGLRQEIENMTKANRRAVHIATTRADDKVAQTARRSLRGQLVKLQNAEHALLQENAQLRLRVDTSLGRGELAELMQRMAGKHRGHAAEEVDRCSAMLELRNKAYNALMAKHQALQQDHRASQREHRESIARLEARVAALRAELADARRAAQAAAAAPAARDAVWARGPSPHRSKAERGAGRAERSAVSLPPDGDDAHSGAAGSEEVSLFDEEEDIFVGESPAVRLPNMEPTEAWSPADAGGGDGAWEGPADDPSDGGPGVGGREPGGGAAAPSCASAGSAREVEPEEEEDSDLTRPGNGSDAEAGASPTSAHAGKREAAAPGQHPNSGSAGSDAPTRGFALAEGTAGGGIQRHAHSWVPEPRPAGKENRSAAAPAAAGRPRLPKRQLTSLYDGEGEAACGAERPGKSVLGASALRAAPGFAGGSDRNPFLRRGAAPAERSASEVGSMLAECGLVEGLSQAPLPPIRSARPVARASEPSFLPKGAARGRAAADGGVLVRHGADGRGGTAKALRPAGVALQAGPACAAPAGGAKRARGMGRGGDGLTIRHFFARAPQ